ncbi:carbohydrate-binding module family 5 protein [Atractiella rhizophila]|nr:carbohydrate-binding module family 5 protein [Atractiella rhizophila]
MKTAISFATLAAFISTVFATTGDGTVYDVGLGACGINNVASDNVVAVGHALYDSTIPAGSSNPNLATICGRSILATNPANGVSVTVTVVDRCVGCTDNDLDFARGPFAVLYNGADTGRFPINWQFTDGTTTPPPASGNCANVAAWDVNAIYWGGDQATFQGYLWVAQWWTQGESPVEGVSLPWKKVAPCSTARSAAVNTTTKSTTAKSSKKTHGSKKSHKKVTDKRRLGVVH